MSYFTEDLLTSIKLRSMAPTSQSTFDDTAILGLAYEELELKVVSDLIKVREDFFLTSEFQSIVGLLNRYQIPTRAIGNALKAVFYVDAGGTESGLQKIDVSEAYKYYGTTGIPEAFAIEGDEILLFPTPATTSGQIEIKFAAKPNKLVSTSTCAKITSISSTVSTASFIVDTDLTATLSVGAYVDFLSVKSPFKLWAYRCQVSQVTSTQIDVSLSSVINGAGVIRPSVGDYICLTDCANIPQIPTAFHPVLAQMTAVRLIESLGDINKLQVARATSEQMRSEALVLVRNRVETKPDKVVNKRGLKRYL